MHEQLRDPRPFYIMGHNTNTIEEVREALEAGANALETDVNVYEGNSAELCISHNEGGAEAPSLEQFLRDLHTLAGMDMRLSLVVFDCKSAVATPEHGFRLLTAIRNCLTKDTGLNIIISVRNMEMGSIFDQIKDNLTPREGLMIDEINDPESAIRYFQNAGVRNQCYGNGISIPRITVTGPNVMPSLEKACGLRAATGLPVFICVWTVNEERLKEEFIHIGVDGIISDDLKELSRQVSDLKLRSVIRMATRADNPFLPMNHAYCLTVHTGDHPMAGTDANITFTLKGSEGSSAITVNADFHSRMERNKWNFISLQSPDLGELHSITVQRDHKGNAPDWWLDKIVVESAVFAVSKTAQFDMDIKNSSPLTKPLL